MLKYIFIKALLRVHKFLEFNSVAAAICHKCKWLDQIRLKLKIWASNYSKEREYKIISRIISVANAYPTSLVKTFEDPETRNILQKLDKEDKILLFKKLDSDTRISRKDKLKLSAILWVTGNQQSYKLGTKYVLKENGKTIQFSDSREHNEPFVFENDKLVISKKLFGKNQMDDLMVDFLGLWRIFGYVFPRKFRNTVVKPLIRELKKDEKERRLKYGERYTIWFTTAFTIQTIGMVFACILNCFATGAGKLLLGLLPGFVKKFWRD